MAQPRPPPTIAPRPPPGVLVRLCEVAGEAEDEFNHWYQQHHLAEQLAVDGFRTARRYQVAGGEPTYMTVYECASIDVLASPAYRAAVASPSAAAQRWMPHVRDTLQLACRQTWSVGEGIGGSAIVVQCKPMLGREESARAFIRDSFGPERMPALVRMSLWEADAALGAVFAPSHGTQWVLSMESYDAAKMALAVHARLLSCESGKTGLLVGSWTRYQLLCARSNAALA